jgi:thioredoxin reductase
VEPQNGDAVTDVTIIGGGPVGLYGVYSCGLHGLSCRLIERLPHLGGQLTALYPEKLIFDVAGYPAVRAQVLVEALREQAFQYAVDLHMGEEVRALRPDAEGVSVETDRGTYRSRTVVITAGIGQFSPRRLGTPAVDRAEGRGVHYVVGSLRTFHGREVVIVGGGNSAADWAINLAGLAKSITLVHRRPTFQCHPDSAQKLRQGPFRLEMRQALVDVEMVNDHVAAVLLRDTETGAEQWLQAQEVIIAIGLVADLGPLRQAGLTVTGNEIPISPAGETNLPRVYAAGDIVTYPGKIKLIATGFGEVATAVYGAAHWLRSARP